MQIDLNPIKEFLFSLFRQNASATEVEWLDNKIQQLQASGADKDLYLAFSATPRFISKNLLQLAQSAIKEADTLRKGFYPVTWTVDQLARTLLLLSLPLENKERFLAVVNQLFSTADMRELVALYAALPLFPYPEAFVERAAEGIRTNMGNVFEAVAQHNPYPAENFGDDAWNQVVLKSLFVGKPLFRIYGIDDRKNAKLARILSDYAHERWSAGRPVTPELWRPVGPFIDEPLLEDIKKLFAHPDRIQHEAAALACAQSDFPGAKALLEAYPELKQQIEKQEITWDLIGEKALSLP